MFSSSPPLSTVVASYFWCRSAGESTLRRTLLMLPRWLDVGGFKPTVSPQLGRVSTALKVQTVPLQSRGYEPVTLEACLKLRSVYVKRAKIRAFALDRTTTICYHDRLDKGITRCSTLLPIRGSAGMPSSLSGYLPLTG